jgi:hypothetical protein
MKSEPVTILLGLLADVFFNRFAQIGDQVLALAVTDLIQQLYPHLRVGSASVRRCAVIPLNSGIIFYGD